MNVAIREERLQKLVMERDECRAVLNRQRELIARMRSEMFRLGIGQDDRLDEMIGSPEAVLEEAIAYFQRLNPYS